MGNARLGEPSKAPRARRKPGENRSVLLTAGTYEFGLRGYSAAQTSAIAKRAGVRQPNLYASFASKQELFIACTRELLNADPAALSDAQARMLFQSVAAAGSRDEFSVSLREILRSIELQFGEHEYSSTLLRAAKLLSSAATIE